MRTPSKKPLIFPRPAFAVGAAGTIATCTGRSSGMSTHCLGHSRQYTRCAETGGSLLGEALEQELSAAFYKDFTHMFLLGNSISAQADSCIIHYISILSTLPHECIDAVLEGWMGSEKVGKPSGLPCSKGIANEQVRSCGRCRCHRRSIASYLA